VENNTKKKNSQDRHLYEKY